MDDLLEIFQIMKGVKIMKSVQGSTIIKENRIYNTKKKYHRIGTFFLDSKKILQSQLKHKKVK